VKNSPIESMEIKTPVVVEERSLRTDSGGAGRYRGGLGIDVRVRNLVEGKWNMARPRRRKCPPWGLRGGGQGGGAEYFLKLADSDAFDSVDQVMRPVPPDSQVIIRTGAGGGWGDPMDRDPQLVLDDVRSGFVSLEGALRDYGVVIDKGMRAVDAAATQAARAARRQAAAE
jgi:N-methylhydantoinase B